jgi:hypothetical protein
MPKGQQLASRETYAGRSPDVVVINCTVERRAAAILRQLSPTAKGLGRLITRMAYDFEERLADRQRLWEQGVRELLAAVIDTNTKDVHGEKKNRRPR